MKKIEKFFEKRRLDAKFSRAGPGHRLDPEKTVDAESPVLAAQATEAARNAALERFQQNIKPPVDRSAEAIRRKAREELAKEAASKELKVSTPEDVAEESTEGIFFECPDLLPGLILPRPLLFSRIEDMLCARLDEEPLVSGCLLFRTFNRDQAQVDRGIALISKYLTNLKEHPDERSKYERIREQNAIFQQTLGHLNYLEEVMSAMGFRRVLEGDQYVYKYQDSLDDIDMHLDVLLSSQPVQVALYRDRKVYKPTSKEESFQVPDSFYELSASDVRKRYEQGKLRLEMEEVLMTKEMRKKLEDAAHPKYKFCIVRVKLPDGLLLQGTFKARESMLDVVKFVQDSLADREMKFSLICRLASATLTVDSKEPSEESLSSLGLCPAVLFLFHHSGSAESFLNEECLHMLTEL